MTTIGKLNTLRVIGETDHGVRLNGEELGPILLPKKFVPENCAAGDEIEVFISLDSDDRLIATTKTPYVMADEFAVLKVVSVTGIGAFLDWGLEKDLLVPFREQNSRLQEGRSCVAYVYVDETSQRIVASTRIDRHIIKGTGDLENDQPVELLIYARTDLGYKAIINGKYSGILYENEAPQNLQIGKKIEGFIKKVRSDEKVDLCVQKPGREKVDALVKTILRDLKEQNGRLDLTPNSSPELINDRYGVSKKTYKKAIGGLYKRRLILIEEDCIRLAK